jgi:hypothetical protein
MIGFRGLRAISDNFRECFALNTAMRRVREEMGLTNVRS